MQQVQQRGLPERISWARAMIFAVGFFFIAALLVGQIPGYIYLQLTASTMEGLERGSLALAVTCLAGFVIIQVIMLLFDPKPVLPPIIFTGLGGLLTLAGLALTTWASFTGCTKDQPTCHQYFPTVDTPNLTSLLNGRFLWFQQNAADLVMIGIAVLGVGVAMIFYSQLALRERRNPDRRDLGFTPAIRFMLIGACVMLVVFLIFYTMYDNQGLALAINKDRPFFTRKILDTICALFLGSAVFLALGAFALRLHYLMRPVRKRTMPALYAVGALGLAQLGFILLIAWVVIYPLIAWMHTWTFLALGDYWTLCARKTAVPQSCSFSPQFGYLVDAIVTTNFFALLLASIWAWKSHRNLVIIGSVVVTAVLGFATLLVHTGPDFFLVALLLTGGMLVLAAVWTSIARREFAVVGENNLGCLGQWLVMGTCLFIYLAAFAFFSLPQFSPETEPNVPFVPGQVVSAPPPPGQPPVVTASDAVVMLVVLGILAAIQFYFLTRNRYKV